MATYASWKAAGRPVLIEGAIRGFGDNLRAHGYIVYYVGDERHLSHTPPEDHTPFSATGWPGRHPYPHILAADVMPPAPGQRSKITGKPLPSLQRIGAQLIADKRSGHPGAAFVKYLNTEPERDNGGPCWHYSWTPGEARKTSPDRGHLHVSSRTDFATSTASDDYDVVARIMGDDDDMPLSTDMITITASTAKRMSSPTKTYAEGEKVSAATLLQLAFIRATDAYNTVTGLDADLGTLLAPEAPAADKAEAVRSLLGDDLTAVLALLK